MIDTSIYLNLFLTIGGLYLGLNVLGLLYSKFVIDGTIYWELPYIHKHLPQTFNKHLPLILINLMLMLAIFPAGLHLMSDILIIPYQNFGIMLGQVFAMFLIDDLYFYFYHRLLHKNKFLYKNIHYIHHRASKPFPSDYLYEHPLEWMLGLLGPFIAILVLGGVAFPALILFLIIRTLHELDIHSGIASFYKKIPFAGTNEHHALHHKVYDIHYASVFSLWDKVFKTDKRRIK